VRAYTHIAVEGIDGCGKGTQTQLLVEHLTRAGFDARLVREPTDGPIGQLIREQLIAPTISEVELNVLFAADRIIHCMMMARQADARDKQGGEGELVFVSDRSVWSSYAYHGVDNPAHAHISPENTRPDFTVVIDLDPGLALNRMLSRDDAQPDRFENFERMSSAREAYVTLCERHPDRLGLVDGDGSIYSVADAVTARVDQWLTTGR